jgi:hypothetical protein
MAKNIPIEVRSQANQPFVRTSASGYWISRAEMRKLVEPCCTPGTTETGAWNEETYHHPVIHARNGLI